MSLGFEQAGFDVVAAVEYDPVHAAAHLFNFPQTELICRDVRMVTGDDVMMAAERGFRKVHPRREWAGRLDAVVGGPPCQGFSSGGKREDGDERNDLLLEFVRLVEELKPRTVCLENVAGLLETKFERVREEAFRRLRRSGYLLSGTTGVLNAVDFGVPQVRRRMIVLGSLGEIEPPRPTSSHAKVTVGDAFEGLPEVSRYEDLLSSDVAVLDDEALARRSSAAGAYARELSGVAAVANDKSRPRNWDPKILTGSRRTVHAEQTIRRFTSTEEGGVEPKSRLFRLRSGGPSRTLRAGTGSERGSHTSPRPIHPTEDRVVTVREAARLHGYPDWFRFHTTNWHGHRQIGNSVPPQLAKAAASALLSVLGRKPVALRSSLQLGDPALLHLSQGEAARRFDAPADERPRARVRQSLATSIPDCQIVTRVAE